MKRALNSSKFWTAIVDAVITITLGVAGAYADKQTFEIIKLCIFAIQPVFAIVIAGIAIEDAATKLSKPN